MATVAKHDPKTMHAAGITCSCFRSSSWQQRMMFVHPRSRTSRTVSGSVSYTHLRAHETSAHL
eukprot:7432543-Alexandrium_andersonii.AAC.1